MNFEMFSDISLIKFIFYTKLLKKVIYRKFIIVG